MVWMFVLSAALAAACLMTAIAVEKSGDSESSEVTRG